MKDSIKFLKDWLPLLLHCGILHWALVLLSRLPYTIYPKGSLYPYRYIMQQAAVSKVFISFDQLLPTARDYGEHHLTIYGLVSGMAVMAISLLLFL